MVMMVYDDIGNIFYSKQVVTSANNTLCDIPACWQYRGKTRYQNREQQEQC